MKIPEIELNFSNVCWASCYICSKPHGSGNYPFMTDEVFNVLIDQLKDIDTDQVQTSGNGECWLHPKFYEYIKRLKKIYPDKPMWNYNNFSMMNKERCDLVIKEKLFDKIHVRIDSINPIIQEKTQRINPHIQLENIKYFLENNDCISFVILYSDIKQYFKKCHRIIGKQPQYNPFIKEDWAYIHDEEQEVYSAFSRFAKDKSLFSVCRINQSLWAERDQALIDKDIVCPKLSVIKNVCWVSPNGDIQVCCYDDRQKNFTCGNILDDHIWDIWTGTWRQQILKEIENKVYNGKYPCTNPQCCSFGG